MQPAQPTNEHRWLQRLVGEWTVEMECSLGPDQPPMKSHRRETVRSLGELWTIGESGDDTPGSSSDSIMTLGFNTDTGRFVGTYITSMMTHLWPYTGALDATGQVLTLDSEGPSLAGDGTLAKYQDSIEFVTDDYRILASQMLGSDGRWTPFMKAHYRRRA